MTTRDDDRIGLGDLVVEATIDADRAAVWQALTVRIHEWWPAEFYSGGDEATRRMTFDARPGGHLAEHWDGDDGGVWATVQFVERNARLEVLGTMFPRFGGPSLWFGAWELEAAGDATRLRFTEHALGRVAEKYQGDKLKGWRFLFADALKAFVEGGPPPEWRD